jgi:lincosamide nucleotidyltransferase A/C/D/E
MYRAMESRALLRYRLSDRANTLVWALPAPRRVKVRLSLLVYRSPPMHAARVIETLDALDAAGIEAPVIGGWGVDALLGEQSRVHRDLDLIVDHERMDTALEVLAGLGYGEWYREESSQLGDVEVLGDVVAVRDSALQAVELHPVAVDLAGLDLVQGSIGSRSVSCFSADQQIRAHAEFTKRARDDRQKLEANVNIAKLVQRSGSRKTGLPG